MVVVKVEFRAVLARVEDDYLGTAGGHCDVWVRCDLVVFLSLARAKEGF